MIALYYTVIEKIFPPFICEVFTLTLFSDVRFNMVAIRYIFSTLFCVPSYMGMGRLPLCLKCAHRNAQYLHMKVIKQHIFRYKR